MLGEVNVLCTFGTLFLYDPHHLGNNITRATDNDRVSQFHTQAFDFIAVVQRGIADGYPAHKYRLQTGDRRHRTGSPDLEIHPLQNGHLLLGRKLVGDCPPRRPGDKAEAFLSRLARKSGDPLAPYWSQRTGRPAEGVVAVIAVSELGLDARGLATTMFVTGHLKGQFLLGQIRPHPSVRWLLGTGEGRPLITDFNWMEIRR